MVIWKEEQLLMVNRNAQCKSNSLWTNNTKEDWYQWILEQYCYYIPYLNKAVSNQMVISPFYFSVFYNLPAIKNKTFISQFDIMIVFFFADQLS